MSKTSTRLTCFGFNQDQGCFAVGTETGFSVFTSDPVRETSQRQLVPSGGFSIVAMLFRTNILALVGTKNNAQCLPTKVMIWDDHQGRFIGELTFRSEVKCVCLRRDKIIVVLETKVYVYNFADLTVLDRLDTAANPRGLCALSMTSDNAVLAVPGLQRGSVRVELYNSKETTMLLAHESALSCIAINSIGTRVATASENGTLIRVFDSLTGELIHELRRGVGRADLHAIAFSHDSKFLAACSDTGTVHVFRLDIIASEESKRDSSAKQQLDAAVTMLSDAFKSLVKSSNSQIVKSIASLQNKSFASVRLPSSSAHSHTALAFGPGPEYSVIVLTTDGFFFKFLFDPIHGGECIQDLCLPLFLSPTSEDIVVSEPPSLEGKPPNPEAEWLLI